MPLTNSAKQKQYRERMKLQNPEKYEIAKKKNEERNKKRKKIKDFDEAGKAEEREKWRNRKNKYIRKSDNDEPEEDSERLGALAEPPAKMPRMKANPSGTCAKDTQLHKAVQTINETENRKSPYSAFAEHVAYKLNTYDRCTRAQVEFKISKILFHADMGILQSEVTANSDPLSHADLHAEDHETIVKQEHET